MKLTRRQFLTSAALLPISLRYLEAATQKPIAILGGGIAGLTAALELHRKGYSVGIYEAASRLGGRILTVPNFNSDKMCVDLGGEFVDSNHHAIRHLCENFKIPLDKYADHQKGLEPNIYFFNHQAYTDQDAAKAYKSISGLIRKDVLSLDQPAILKKFDRLPLEKYLSGFSEMTEKWFIQFLAMAMTSEAGIDLDQASALTLLQSIGSDPEKPFSIYGESDQAYCIRGGSTKLIEAISEALNKKSIYLNHHVSKIEETATHLKFSFENGKQKSFHRVICTLPFSVLRYVEGIKKLNLRPTKKDCILNCTYNTSGKVILGFKNHEWMVSGKKSNGMVYSDLQSQNCYDSGRTQKGKSGLLTNFVGGKAGLALKPEQQPLYLGADKQIFSGLEPDGNALTWNWATQPLSKGAYFAYGIGDVTRFQNVMPLSELNGRLLFAGEHADLDSGGFMNSAAASGLRAAREIAKG